MRFKNKKAFTLAEVLITLTIIGVVSAITIPTVKRVSNERQTISQLKAVHSILGQALKSSEAEYGSASTWTEERWTQKGAEEIAEKLIPFFKIAENCGIEDKNRICVHDNSTLKNGEKSTIFIPTDVRYYKFKLNNGITIWFKSTDAGEFASGDYLVIFTDLNGKTPPNKWGTDIFAFTYSDDKLIPWGAKNSHYPFETACLAKDATGYGCAYYILTTNKMDY